MNSKLFGALALVALLGACAHKPAATAESGAGAAATTDQASSTTMSPQDELKNQVGDRIFFGFNTSEITGEARQILERQAAFMSKYPNLTFTIEGHCDPRGTREYNLALGERRATATKKALIALGVQASRLQTISYGKERPAVVGDDEAAYAQDRRAVTVIN